MANDIQVLPSIGSNRRLWAQVGHGVQKLFWCTLQLQPTSGAAADVEWCSELQGLDLDLYYLVANMGLNELSNTLLMGDWNFQPDELYGGKEPHRKRQHQ